MIKYKQILEAINRGIKFALDDFEDDNDLQGQVSSKVSHQHGTKEYLDLMNKVVDLGLPSGTLWCKYNLGATYKNTPESWYGKFYAWGELSPKEHYDWEDPNYHINDYKHAAGTNDSLTKYCNNYKYGLNNYIDKLNILQQKDDVAYQNIHLHNFKFHIPTKEQCEELKEYTTSEYIKDYKDIENLKGLIIKGRNRNEIFFPCAGYYNNRGQSGLYRFSTLWTSTLCEDIPIYAYSFDLSPTIQGTIMQLKGTERCCGLSIRPVINL